MGTSSCLVGGMCTESGCELVADIRPVNWNELLQSQSYISIACSPAYQARLSRPNLCWPCCKDMQRSW